MRCGGRDGFGVSEIRVHVVLPSLLTIINPELEAACVIVRWEVAVPSSRGVSKDQRCPWDTVRVPLPLMFFSKVNSDFLLSSSKSLPMCHYY